MRRAHDLDATNFVLYGHSWGGILAIEYALAHPGALKALVISNMMSSFPAYNDYANRVLVPQIDPAVVAEIRALEATDRTDDPRYEALLFEHHYVQHVLRMPVSKWPEPVTRAFSHLNKDVYVPMQGPSELGGSGKLIDWDRTEELTDIRVPALVISAQHDTMDPEFMAAMSERLPKGVLLHCPNGSHLAMYDDQVTYMDGLLSFLAALD